MNDVEVAASAPLAPTAAPPACNLIVDGDSWLSYWLGNLTVELKAQNFAVDGLARPQTELRLFCGGDDPAAPSGPRLDQLCSHIRDAIVRNRPLDAIVLSLGGNDAVRDTLTRLVEPCTAAGAPRLNEAAVANFIDQRMNGWFTRVLTNVAAAGRRRDGSTVPIFVHGYDYPVPDGRPSLEFLGASLRPYLEQAGYTRLPDRIDIMRLLIDRLNLMQMSVCSIPSLAAVVSHVDLRKTLSNAPDDYQNDWRNELHPLPAGFARLADKLGAAVRQGLAARIAAPADS